MAKMKPGETPGYTILAAVTVEVYGCSNASFASVQLSPDINLQLHMEDIYRV